MWIKYKFTSQNYQFWISLGHSSFRPAVLDLWYKQTVPECRQPRRNILEPLAEFIFCLIGLVTWWKMTFVMEVWCWIKSQSPNPSTQKILSSFSCQWMSFTCLLQFILQEKTPLENREGFQYAQLESDFLIQAEFNSSWLWLFGWKTDWFTNKWVRRTDSSQTNDSAHSNNLSCTGNPTGESWDDDLQESGLIIARNEGSRTFSFSLFWTLLTFPYALLEVFFIGTL